MDIIDISVAKRHANQLFGKLSEDIADLKYIPIDITKLSNNVGTVEMGTIVNAVNLSWWQWRFHWQCKT